MDNSNHASAADARRAIETGTLTAEQLAEACIARIERREGEVAAWAHFDPRPVLEQARRLDRIDPALRGPLHGVPMGIKDIFDTGDMPTELGSVLHRQRRPARDAAVVTFLREAGAVILGKTATTEFALSTPAKTRNPLSLDRTPGGSSSGSAAAVADFMTPLSVGTQTGGSVIRPGAFCGVHAYKPTFGSISRRGMNLLSRRLDHVGVFARSIEDLALIGDVLMHTDADDRDMRGSPACGLQQALVEEKRTAPRFVFVRSPVWNRADPIAQRTYLDFCQRLGNRVTENELPESFEHAQAFHHTILGGCLAATFEAEIRDSPDQLSAQIKARITEGISVSASSYLRALDGADALAVQLDEWLGDYDAIITPSACGEAPRSLDTTGDPAFNAMWTLCGAPAITLPLLEGENHLPIGVQLVGRRGEDAALLRAAAWLARTIHERAL